MRVIFALERTNSFRGKAYIDPNKPKSPMKANFMFSKEGRCASHYNRQNPIKLGKCKNTETKFNLVHKILELNSVVHSMFITLTKWVRGSGEQYSVCMRNGGSQRENLLQRFKVSDSTYFLFPVSLFLFFNLECFKIKTKNNIWGILLKRHHLNMHASYICPMQWD